MKEQKTQATKVNIKADENAKAASAIDSGSNFYGLTNDYMFKVIMQENVYVREMLIRALLGLDEEELTYSEVLNPIIPGYAIDNKTCILDLNLMLNNKEKLNLEMQVIKDQAWEKRSLYYWARNYADLKAGNNYAELKRTTHIGILDHTPVSEHPEFYSRYELRNIRSNRTYSDVIDIRTLDLTRVDLAYPEEYGIAYWAKIIKAASWEELDRLTEGNEVLEDMTETMRKLAEDQREQWILQQREFYGYEMASQYHGGYNDGVADQKIETDKANKRADKERQRADEAERRADEAERRAEELANELAALKVKHGS